VLRLAATEHRVRRDRAADPDERERDDRQPVDDDGRPARL